MILCTSEGGAGNGDRARRISKTLIQEEVEASLRAKRNESGMATASMRTGGVGAAPQGGAGLLHSPRRTCRMAYSDKLREFLKDFQQLSGERLNLTFMKDELSPEAKCPRADHGAADRTCRPSKRRLRRWIMGIEARTPEAPIEACALQTHGHVRPGGLLSTLCPGGRLGSHGAANQRLRGLGTATAFGRPGRDRAAARRGTAPPTGRKRQSSVWNCASSRRASTACGPH